MVSPLRLIEISQRPLMGIAQESIPVSSTMDASGGNEFFPT